MSKEDLKARAIAIRDEVLEGRNTAERVGQLLLDMIDSPGDSFWKLLSDYIETPYHVKSKGSVVAYATDKTSSFTMPIATKTSLGAVMAGDNIVIDEQGRIKAVVPSYTGGTWGGITGTLADQKDLKSALDSKSDTDHTHSGLHDHANKLNLDYIDQNLSTSSNVEFQEMHSKGAVVACSTKPGSYTNMPIATKTTLGAVIAGDNISIDEKGRISSSAAGITDFAITVNGQTYRSTGKVVALPDYPTDASTLGGVDAENYWHSGNSNKSDVAWSASTFYASKGSIVSYYGAFGNRSYLWNESDTSLCFGTSNTERLTILPNGRIGVNNTNPYFDFDVNGIFRSTSQIITPSIQFIDTRSANPAPFDPSISRGLTPPHLKHGSIIGINDPVDSFAGVIYVSQWGDSSGGKMHRLAFTDNDNMWISGGSTNWGSWYNFWHSGNSNSPHVDWNAKEGHFNGRVYTKATASTEYFFGNGSDGVNDSGALVYAYNSLPILFYTSSLERMRITEGGNIGFGTTNPQYKVEAAGDIYANGGWLRTSGNNGWYSQTHGGGIYMEDSNWVRVYGGKHFLCQGVIQANTGVYSYNGGGMWISGKTTDRCHRMENVSSNSFHTLARVSNEAGASIALGGIGNQLGFWTYLAGRTTNGTDGTFHWNASNNRWYMTGAAFEISGLLQVSGNIYSTGRVVAKSTSSGSDRRLKNIKGKESKFLDRLKKLNVYKFTLKSDEDQEVMIGVIAQEIAKQFPEVVKRDWVEGKKKMLTVDYATLGTIAAIGGINELNKKIEIENRALKRKVERLENKIKSIELLIKKLAL